jgi:hypothetical protein
MPPSLFGIGIFQIGSHFYDQASLDGNHPTYTSCKSVMKGMCHHAQLLLVEMGLAS